jgi:hypothetical protein
MGRRSGFKLHTNRDSNINIITVYQSTKSDGLHTNYMYQISHMKKQGITNPDPRKQLMIDLQLMIGRFNTKNESTIVLIDANDGLYQKQSLLPTFLHNTNLVPLVSNLENYPPTHSRGSYCIDFVFGSPNTVPFITSSGISGFFDQPWPHTDHRGLFININIVGLFGATIHTIPESIPRRVTSKSKKLCNKFVKLLYESEQIPPLFGRIQLLNNVQHWNTSHHKLFDQIDIEFTKILLLSEHKCAVPINHPWNTELHQKYLIYTYWKVYLSGKKNRKNVSKQLDTIQKDILPNTIYQSDLQRPPTKQLLHARKNLIDARTDSFQ